MSPIPYSITACPRCGGQIQLTPHPTKPGRLIGECGCNLSPEGLYLGPVIETNMGQPKSEWQNIKRVDTRKRGGEE